MENTKLEDKEKRSVDKQDIKIEIVSTNEQEILEEVVFKILKRWDDYLSCIPKKVLECNFYKIAYSITSYRASLHFSLQLVHNEKISLMDYPELDQWLNFKIDCEKSLRFTDNWGNVEEIFPPSRFEELKNLVKENIESRGFYVSMYKFNEYLEYCIVKLTNDVSINKPRKNWKMDKNAFSVDFVSTQKEEIFEELVEKICQRWDDYLSSVPQEVCEWDFFKMTYAISCYEDKIHFSMGYSEKMSSQPYGRDPIKEGDFKIDCASYFTASNLDKDGLTIFTSGEIENLRKLVKEEIEEKGFSVEEHGNDTFKIFEIKILT